MAPSAILEIHRQKNLFLKKHHKYAKLVTFSELFKLYNLLAVRNFYALTYTR